MSSANQTPGEYKFAPLVASQQGRANQHKPACFGLSSPWSSLSRSGLPLGVAIGAPAYRRTIERRAAASTKALRRKTKQNKTNVTSEKDAMSSANQTPGEYKFAPLVASQQGRANQHEPACFGLSSPWSSLSRSGLPLHAVVQPWLSLQRSISP